MTAPEIIAAYERREKAAGGVAAADLLDCIRGAARDCGVSENEARDVMRAHWAGMAG